MDAYAQLSALLDLAEQVGLTVRLMPAAAEGSDHPGGALVRVKGKEVLFLDSDASVADRLVVVARSLAERKELEDRFIPPELREIIEKNR